MTFTPILKAIAISILAALLGGWIATVVVFGRWDGWPGPLVFTVPGSLLLASAYGVARLVCSAVLARYAFVLAVGAAAGMLMLVVPGFALGVVGAAYGSVIAACWIALHLISRPRGAPLYKDYGVSNA